MKKFINRRVRSRGSISVNIITKNEEENIRRAIKSVRDLVDEVIVVDTGSKDNTLDIAVSEGAKVGQIEWEDNFSKPRNKALEMSKSSWILSIDADEVIPKRGREEIIEMTKWPEVAGWRMETWNYKTDHRTLDIQVNDKYYEEGNEYTHYVKSIKTRLFQKRKGVCWEFPIHEVVDRSIGRLKGRFAKAKIAVQHFHKEMSEKEKKSQVKFYLKLAEKKVRQNKRDGHAWGELAVCELISRLYPRAARSYYNAIRYGEDSAKNRYGYAGVLKILGARDKSDREINRAICKDFPNLTTIK